MINFDYLKMINAFSDIWFQEDIHKYTDSLNTNFTSVTTFVSKFEPDKDWDLIAEKAAKKPKNKGKTAQDLRAEWKTAGDKSCILGTHCHSVFEYGWQNKEYFTPEHAFDKYPELKEDFDFRKEKSKNMIAKMKEIYIPIKNEFIIYDTEWKLCGTIDFLAYNKKKDCISILDWKTNKKWEFNNKYNKLKAPFNNLDDCNISHYELQLNIYKAILEKHTDIKVDEMILIHIPSKEQGVSEIHRCNNYQNILIPYLNSIK